MRTLREWAPRRGGRKALHGRLLAVLAVTLAACSSSAAVPTTTPGETPQIVSPDSSLPTLVVNVNLTDAGFEPETIFLPAGRHIRLVVRNHSDREHHYRVIGLIPAQLAWEVQPHVTADEFESMLPEQREALGIAGDVDDIEHVLHHLTPTYVPYKGESRSGIQPLPNEVHAYVYRGVSDIVTFYPLNIGEFVAEDVLYPELTGRVVVFDPQT